MDAHWFKDHIEEELDDACLYAKKAIEIKPMKAEWSKQLSTMATEEMEHAGYLYKMFNTYYTIMAETYKDSIPEFIEDTKQCVDDMYLDRAPEIKVLLDMYSRM